MQCIYSTTIWRKDVLRHVVFYRIQRILISFYIQSCFFLPVPSYVEVFSSRFWCSLNEFVVRNLPNDLGCFRRVQPHRNTPKIVFIYHSLSVSIHVVYVIHNFVKLFRQLYYCKQKYVASCCLNPATYSLE